MPVKGTFCPDAVFGLEFHRLFLVSVTLTNGQNAPYFYVNQLGWPLFSRREDELKSWSDGCMFLSIPTSYVLAEEILQPIGSFSKITKGDGEHADGHQIKLWQSK